MRHAAKLALKLGVISFIITTSVLYLAGIDPLASLLLSLAIRVLCSAAHAVVIFYDK